MGIGEKLARQRILLGMSLDDMAATTGMSIRQLSAIEAGADTFASSTEMGRMLRLYARKLGVSLDVEHGRMNAGTDAPAVIAPPPIPRFLLKPTASRAD